MKSFDYRHIIADAILRVSNFVDVLGTIIGGIYAFSIAVAMVVTFGMLCGINPPQQAASSVVIHNVWTAIKLSTLLTFLMYLGYEINILFRQVKNWATIYKRNKKCD